MSSASSMPDAYAGACAPRSAGSKARTDVRTYEEVTYGRNQSSGPYQARTYVDFAGFLAASRRNRTNRRAA